MWVDFPLINDWLRSIYILKDKIAYTIKHIANYILCPISNMIYLNK